ncbi:MAG TPA: hypothetical protein VFI22_10120 [Thermomicrobiales bacterium]|nr:hypothetical protein [Thermomicrobiales bacterium]
MAAEQIQVDLGSGTAELHARNMEALDSFTIPNALSGGPTAPATISFDLWWHTPTATEQWRDEAQGFAATLLDVTSAIGFTAESGGFIFVSDPPDTANSLYARIGFEANGVFLPPEGASSSATPTG